MTEVLDEAVSILGFDPFDRDFRADPYACYDRIRGRGRVWRTDGQLLLAPSHQAASRVFRDQRFGHHSGVPGPVPFRRPSSAATGTTRWFVVLDPPDHTRLRRQVGTWPNGTPKFEPSGGGVWATPAIDPVTHTLYAGTGQNYSGTAGQTDSMLALDAYTGCGCSTG